MMGDIELLVDVTLKPGLVTSADVLPQHRVGIGTNTTLKPQQVSFDTDAFLKPVVTHPNILTPLLISDTDAITATSVIQYALPGIFTDTTTFFVPSVAFPILPNLASDADVTFAPRIDQAILPSLFNQDDFVFAASGHGFYLPYYMPYDDVFFSPIGSLVFLPARVTDNDTIFNAASMLGLVSAGVNDNETIYLPRCSTNYSLSTSDIVLDDDVTYDPDILRSDMAVAPDQVSDDDETFPVDLENDAPAVVFMFEDEDVFYGADIATVWIISDDFFDSDDYTDDTVLTSINYVRHAGILGFDEVIPAGLVTQSHAMSSPMGSDDDFFSVGTTGQSGFGPDALMDGDSFSITTFSTDFTLTPLFIVFNDFIYNPVTTLITTAPDQQVHPGRYIDTLESIYQPHTVPPIATLHPSLVAADDMVYAADESARHIYPSLYADPNVFFTPFVGRGRVIASPSRFIDTDNVTTPQVMINPSHSQLHIDFDILIPPFTVQRRGVRSNVGVIQGRIDRVPELIGSRDAP